MHTYENELKNEKDRNLKSADGSHALHSLLIRKLLGGEKRTNNMTQSPTEASLAQNPSH